MPKTLAQIESQIAKLQKEAQALKAHQAASVIAKVKSLIAAHGLSAADLGFGSAAAPAKKAGQAAGKKAGKKASAAVDQAPATAKKAAAKGKRAASAAGKAPKAKSAGSKATTIGVIKYRDAAGNAWTGRGTRPKWFLAALASGKTAEQLQVS
jgi:DNA-binding protein H-NS